jgi:hypothetical protein
MVEFIKIKKNLMSDNAQLSKGNLTIARERKNKKQHKSDRSVSFGL